MDFQPEIVEVGTSLFAKVAFDSYKKGEITINKEKLIEQGIVTGLHVFFIRDKLMVQLSGINPIDNYMLSKFIVDVAGKSTLIILYRMLMSKKYSTMSIFMEQGIGSLIAMMFTYVMDQVWEPANGTSRRNV
jgi:hypothetical protein